jgi:hypothetical protein
VVLVVVAEIMLLAIVVVLVAVLCPYSLQQAHPTSLSTTTARYMVEAVAVVAVVASEY